MKRVKVKKNGLIELRIDKARFCEWYFNNSEESEYVLNDLIEKETIHLSDYLEDIGYLPIDMVVNPTAILQEDRLNEDGGEAFDIENPYERYSLKFAN